VHVQVCCAAIGRAMARVCDMTQEDITEVGLCEYIHIYIYENIDIYTYMYMYTYIYI